MSPIFEYRDYKRYLKDLLAQSPAKGRGLRQKMAHAAGCQLPYVSHVLNADYHFSVEQIEGIGRFFELRDPEKEFLIHLVQYQRAATAPLKSVYKAILERSANQNSSLKQRLQTKDSLSEEDRFVYYSSWHYAAVHMLVTIPEFQTRQKMIERLQMPGRKLDDVLDFLLSCNLIEKKQSRYVPHQTDMHVEKSSRHSLSHHANWRRQAIESLDDGREEDLHYSLVFTVKDEDIPILRETLTSALESCARIIRPSKEEELSALCVDLFKVRK